MLRLAFIVAAVLAAASCSFEPGFGRPTLCFKDADCADGRVCLAGECQEPGSSGTNNGTDDDMGGPKDAAGDTSEPGCGTDGDGDGFGTGPECSEGELDCDDTNPNIYPGAPQVCNGRDNDCDDAVDIAGCECTNGTVKTCGTAVGECATGSQTCVAGKWDACVGGITAVEEACDGRDNDCDGTTDEGCPCMPGATNECGTDDGECSKGTQSCGPDGTWSDCEGDVGPSPELCDGLDNDCDGTDDNDAIDAQGPCDTMLEGICGPGTKACVNLQVVCVSLQAPQVETCNNFDDDCNGVVDNVVPQDCMSACGLGTQVCEMGQFQDCVPTNPPPEVCNGDDDNCNGETDETFPEDGMRCDSGLPGPCGEGTWSCTNANLVCNSAVMPAAESCDGEDNDCDGDIDEDGAGLLLARSCGTCPSGGVELCVGGGWSSCGNQEVELCDGTDTNCDSAIDNQSVCYQVCNGAIVAGTLTCGSGGTTCSLGAEICGDGIDNDCDGTIDTNCNTDVDDMVLIPGGTFLMGSRPAHTNAAVDETPIHVVELDPYYMDRTEVSRTEYGACVGAFACSTLAFGCPLQLTNPNKPIVCVSHAQAAQYCAWKGKRLPTEAEFEKAARGPFARETFFPWGDMETAANAVFNCGGSPNMCTVDVDTYPQGESYYGIRHLSGNVSEWVSDYYDANFYTASYTVNPENTTMSASGFVLRGGTYSQEMEFGRVANRQTDGFLAGDEIGFRCAKDLP